MKYCTVCKTKYEDNVSFCTADGEVLEDDPSSIVGTVLDGQYQIEALLGKGGMGAVYRARHILLGDRVAIKILPTEVRNNAEWLRRFRREGQAARRFRHPNAVTVYDLRTAGDGTIYMVMEYVEGHTLDAEIKRRGRFTPDEAVAILEPIMSVLHTAHAMGVVHRDLKPDNIMIGKASTGEGPSVKLLDLGIAKMREVAGSDSGGTTALTLAGQVLGTPYYMSPEQWGELPKDGNSEIDGRADIYSLGLVVYEMITGKRPVSGLTLHELRREHLSVTPPLLEEVVPDVPREFSEAIARALSKDRGDRPATAGDLAAQLRLATGMTAPAAHTTFPDIPPLEQSRAETVEAAKTRQTRSDVDAPTVLTNGAMPTVGPGVPQSSPSPQPIPSAESRPAYVSSPAASSSPDFATIAESASGALPATTALPQIKSRPEERVRRKGGLIVAGAIVGLVVLVTMGLGGFYAFNWLTSEPGNNTPGNENVAVVDPATEVTTRREVGHYWLELWSNKPDSQTVRVAGVVPLASGQAFKFHFVFGNDGYLYIVGPGQQNEPTAFLTARPPAGSGLDSNRVTRGANFSFPKGDEHWVELDKKPGTETYTVLFSPVPLESPLFLASQATGEPLSSKELDSWNDFLSKSKVTKPVVELNNGDGTAPFVTIKLPEAEAEGNPIIFEIRIQHK
ncbi:MAG TPA: serine/threonine-protein kinase [Pyrinomonadaceae bacterium]|nr:serine/threonine-protein kinase [Pyrinomonadaceae bacterium]